MKITIFIFLLLFSFGSWAQEIIYVAPLQTEHVKPGGSVKGLLKNNQISRDSLTRLTNQKILSGLKTSIPDAEFILADSAFLKLLADSSELKQLLTTSHLDVVNGVAGFERTKARMKGGPTFYDGRNFNPGGIAISLQKMLGTGAKYFILINKFEASTDFEIHFELYDKDFTKIYGDRFFRPSNTSHNMYFSTFLYYFDKFVVSFDEEIVKKINLANTIRQ